MSASRQIDVYAQYVANSYAQYKHKINNKKNYSQIHSYASYISIQPCKL